VTFSVPDLLPGKDCVSLLLVLLPDHHAVPAIYTCCCCCCCQVITREVDGAKMEPYEEAVVEVPEQYVGSVVELFAQRKGEMQDMQPSIEVSC
jgi:hypothetical protein